MDSKNIYKILLPKKESVVNETYFKRYYHTSHLSDRVICDICGRSASVQKLYRHQKTTMCMEIFNNLTLKNNL